MTDLLSIARPPDTTHEAVLRPETTVEGLIGTGSFPRAVQLLARSFVTLHEASPRTTALFATQQRWLLCHAALAHHFRAALDGRPGLTRRAFGHLALRHGIASRNTAHAFFDEALKYEVVHPAGRDGDQALVVPSPATLAMLLHWYEAHFRALDLIDDGRRTDRFLADPGSMLAQIQPVLAEALLADPEVRAPGPLYTIFTWADAGGLLMDRLIAGIDAETMSGRDRLLTDVNAISHLAQSFGLSRAHTSRKLSAAEAIGGIGWTGRRGRSRVWISSGFYGDYALAQARKLVILDSVFEEFRAAFPPKSG